VSRSSLAQALVLIGLSSGCAHGWYAFPGPLGSLGLPSPLEGYETGEGADGSVWDEIDPEEAPATLEERADAEGSAEEASPPAGPRERRRGARVAEAASAYLGASKLRHGGESFRYDCSGLVMAAHARAGLELAGSSESMMTMAKEAGVFHKRKRPQVGDVAFFRDTYDRNGNGRLDDPITHVAVVVSVDEDGTVHMVHKGGRGVTRLSMNLHSKSEHADPQGKEINSYLRSRRSNDRAGTRYLAGELWIGFGSFWRVLQED
jgi:cell wall-associated NlpC family hydrolase